MNAGHVPLRWLVSSMLLVLGWGGRSMGASGDYASCQWATPSTQDSWIRERYLRQGDFALLGCPITPEVLVPGQTDGRYTYQRFEWNNKCIAWNWNKPDVWTSPGNFEEMDCSQVRGLQPTPSTGDYTSCQWATPSSQDSWIRDRYVRQGDFALLGCPITGELMVPGQTEGRYTYQRFEKNNKCIAWNWNKPDVWTSPGNFEEMDCSQVRGLQSTQPPPPPSGTAGCNTPAVTGDLLFRRTSTGRSYFLHVPAGLTNTTPQKLVFVWHNCNGSVAFMRSQNGLNLEQKAAAANDKALFVYPLVGSSSDPNVNEGCFQGAGDLPFFDQLLSEIGQSYCIDTRKVFSTGYSSGGIMSDFLGCRRSGAVRAIAPVEGGLTSADVGQCPGKVDALVIHNPKDEQIGWNTAGIWTDGRGFLPLQSFYNNAGCTSPALSGNDTTIQKTVFSCPAPYRVWRILHNSYYAPSTIPNHTIPHGPSPIPDAPTEIWNFFNTVQ